MRSRAVLLVVLALSSAVAASPAHGAPSRTTALAGSSPRFDWTGGPGTGVAGPGVASTVPEFEFVRESNFRCRTNVYDCDDTLVELKEAGSITAAIKAGSGSHDLDVRIIPSDSTGEPAASEDGLAWDTGLPADAQATASALEPGFYVVRVLFYSAERGSYDGTVTYSPPATPQPQSQPVAGPTPTITTCASPRLVLRLARGAARRVSPARRYAYLVRLSCAVKGRRQPAPTGLKVAISRPTTGGKRVTRYVTLGQGGSARIRLRLRRSGTLGASYVDSGGETTTKLVVRVRRRPARS